MSKQSYKEYRQQLEEEQKSMNYDDIKELMSKRNEFLLELDNLPKQQHVWIDRGAKLTCENGGHAYHECWKRR